MRYLLSFFLAGAAVFAQADRVLVVYNSAEPDSAGLATDYRIARNIPAGNLCPVNFGPYVNTIDSTQWNNTFRPAIRACLNALPLVGGLSGPGRILYIVMAYLTPFKLTRDPDGKEMGLDSHIADIWDRYSATTFWNIPSGDHGYYADAQSQGNQYAPFQSLASYRAGGRAQMIYSVWRLDANTRANAFGMVTRALAVEGAGGLTPASGVAYLDRRFETSQMFEGTDSEFKAADHNLYRAARMLQAAGFTVVEDDNDAEIGTAPAPLTAPNSIFYSGWYSFVNYNDVFGTFPAGAIGWHLDSGSATSPRSGASWSPNAVQRGITVTTGSVTEPYLEGLSPADAVVRNLMEGANVGDAFLRNTRWLRWMNMNLGDPLYKPFPTGRAPFNAPLTENALILRPRFQVGTYAVTGTVQLATPAPGPSGQAVSLAVTANSAASLGVSTVTVPAGQRAANFQINTTAVGSNTNIRVTASFNSTVLYNTLFLVPRLAGVGVSPSSVSGGNSVTGLVQLNERAPVGGLTVNLSSSSAAAVVPSTVTIPAGAVTAFFQVTTTAVGTTQSVTITATGLGAQRTATLTLNP
jgi:uncharacterized protein (TIGR03790 family)